MKIIVAKIKCLLSAVECWILPAVFLIRQKKFAQNNDKFDWRAAFYNHFEKRSFLSPLYKCFKEFFWRRNLLRSFSKRRDASPEFCCYFFGILLFEIFYKIGGWGVVVVMRPQVSGSYIRELHKRDAELNIELYIKILVLDTLKRIFSN